MQRKSKPQQPDSVRLAIIYARLSKFVMLLGPMTIGLLVPVAIYEMATESFALSVGLFIALMCWLGFGYALIRAKAGASLWQWLRSFGTRKVGSSLDPTPASLATVAAMGLAFCGFSCIPVWDLLTGGVMRGNAGILARMLLSLVFLLTGVGMANFAVAAVLFPSAFTSDRGPVASLRLRVFPATRLAWLQLGALVAVGVAAVILCRIFLPGPKHPQPFRPVDPVPCAIPGGSLSLNHRQMVLHVSGSPEEIGAQHGQLLRKSIGVMLDGYVRDFAFGRDADDESLLRSRARTLRPNLPAWYLAELSACAKAAGVDEELLLIAQCEGDLRSLNTPAGPQAGCSAYVTFDDRGMRIGRNFDYHGGAFVNNCAVTVYARPRRSDGIPFAAVGWSGVLGGWTLVNAEGLVIANHLGGGSQKNPQGIPTLILTRIVAQKAATIDAALEIIRSSPRMRGQIVWLAQPRSADGSRPARAVAVEYDAEQVAVREAEAGTLIVGNRNLAFGRGADAPAPPAEPDSIYRALYQALHAPPDASGSRPISATWRYNTMHSVEILPEQGAMFVAHGQIPAQMGEFVQYTLPRWEEQAP